MSEFSESVYIHTSQRADGIQWLRDTGTEGYVLEPRGNWVQVFPAWPRGLDDEVKDTCLKKSSGLVLYYRFDADRCWSFVLYREGKALFSYQCLWDDGACAMEGGSVEELAALLAVSDADLNQLLPDDGSDRSWEQLMDNAAEFADLLGLPNYAWASFEYADLDADMTGLDELFVDADGEDEDEDEGNGDGDSTPPTNSSAMPNATPPAEPLRSPDVDAPWQAVYDLASHFLKHLHDEELIELTLDSRLVRDRLVERLTKTVIENPVSSDAQVVHHWLENLMTAPEIVDIFATDDMLSDAFMRAKEDVAESQA